LLHQIEHVADHFVATETRVLVPKKLIEPYLIERYKKVDISQVSPIRPHLIGIEVAQWPSGRLWGLFEPLSGQADIVSVLTSTLEARRPQIHNLPRRREIPVHFNIDNSHTTPPTIVLTTTRNTRIGHRCRS
jgi:hypothetical protein